MLETALVQAAPSSVIEPVSIEEERHALSDIPLE
jgi:hypothetical protein